MRNNNKHLDEASKVEMHICRAEYISRDDDGIAAMPTAYEQTVTGSTCTVITFSLAARNKMHATRRKLFPVYLCP